VIVVKDGRVVYVRDKHTATEAISEMLAIHCKHRKLGLERFSKSDLHAKMTAT
jgi:hypothetical protein